MPVLASPLELQRYLAEFFDLAGTIRSAQRNGQTAVQNNFEQLVELGRNGRHFDANDQHIVTVVDWLWQYAFEQRASDIHLEPRRDLGVVRFRIDGLLNNVYQVPPGVMSAMTSRIKLLGIARRRAEGIELRVHPTLIPARRLLANVEGAMNAVWVKGDAVGETLYYGPGAGKLPTASAVVADLVDVARQIEVAPESRVPYLAFQQDQLQQVLVLPASEMETAYYLRIPVRDEPGVLAAITRIMADEGVSIDAMLQRQPSEGANTTDIILMTHRTVEKCIDIASRRIEALPSVTAAPVRLRVEALD